MTYVTENEDVIKIIERLRHKEITTLQARNEIQSLSLGDVDGEDNIPKGRTASEPAFLDWEIEEAIKEAAKCQK